MEGSNSGFCTRTFAIYYLTINLKGIASIKLASDFKLYIILLRKSNTYQKIKASIFIF